MVCLPPLNICPRVGADTEGNRHVLPHLGPKPIQVHAPRLRCPAPHHPPRRVGGGDRPSCRKPSPSPPFPSPHTTHTLTPGITVPLHSPKQPPPPPASGRGLRRRHLQRQRVQRRRSPRRRDPVVPRGAGGPAAGASGAWVRERRRGGVGGGDDSAGAGAWVGAGVWGGRRGVDVRGRGGGCGEGKGGARGVV